MQTYGTDRMKMITAIFTRSLTCVPTSIVITMVELLLMANEVAFAIHSQLVQQDCLLHANTSLTGDRWLQLPLYVPTCSQVSPLQHSAPEDEQAHQLSLRL